MCPVGAFAWSALLEKMFRNSVKRNFPFVFLGIGRSSDFRCSLVQLHFSAYYGPISGKFMYWVQAIKQNAPQHIKDENINIAPAGPGQYRSGIALFLSKRGADFNLLFSSGYSFLKLILNVINEIGIFCT